MKNVVFKMKFNHPNKKATPKLNINHFEYICKNNVISSYVHKDETTPHMHFCFIPVVIDKKKNFI